MNTAAPREKTFGDVGVAVIQNGHGGTHTGVVFAAADHRHRFLHLAFHHELDIEDPPLGGLYGLVNVPTALKNHLLMLLDRIEPANRDSIIYAFGYTGTTRFDLDNARIVVGPGRLGLTCSTFVLAVFASVGYPLLSLDPWRNRDNDASLMAALIDVLERRERAGLIELGYTEIARREASTCSRYRPEDVLAAGTHPSPPPEPPHAQSNIERRSEEIGTWVRAGGLVAAGEQQEAK